jgi:hypothetical protein
MGILKVYLVVTMFFLFLSIVVADLDVYHNTEWSIRYPSMPPKNLKFEVLPKGIYIPPLEAITKTSNSPLPSLRSTNLNFGMLPRGPSQPSVPDPIVSPSPPQPPHHFKKT